MNVSLWYDYGDCKLPHESQLLLIIRRATEGDADFVLVL